MSGGGPPSLGELVKDPADDVPNYAWTWHYFLKQGVSWQEFKQLPMPYIFLVLETNKIEQEKQEREQKKARSKY